MTRARVRVRVDVLLLLCYKKQDATLTRESLLTSRVHGAAKDVLSGTSHDDAVIAFAPFNF